jgi:hypothetical protein
VPIRHGREFYADEGGDGACSCQCDEPSEKREKVGNTKCPLGQGNHNEHQAENEAEREESGSGGPRRLMDALSYPIGEGINMGQGWGREGGDKIEFDGGWACGKEQEA